MTHIYHANKRLRETEITGLVLLRAERLTMSVNGNPRWRVIFRNPEADDVFTAITQTDGSVSYDVDNYTRSSFKDVPMTVVFSKAGRVVAISPES
jgi:hypothetical protein